MDAAQQLQLRDIHLPDPVSWWPPAPGWWLLLGLVFVAFLSIRYVLILRKRREVRLAALKAIQNLSVHFEAQQDKQGLVRELSVLLRRICLSYFPRVDVAALTGEAWLRFLEEGWGVEKWRGGFTEGPGRSLITAPYQKEATVDAEALLALCGDWIKSLPPLKSR